MKTTIASIASTAIVMSSGFATVSLNFNAEFDTGVPQNFANAAGVPSNGLIWGVLIDGSGNGLVSRNVGMYDCPGPIALGGNYILSVSGVATDDVLYVATALTADTSGSLEGDVLTTGGTGGIYDLNNIALANGVGTGDKFYVVWFDGGNVGTLTDATFTIPADGSLLNYGAPFVGVDPIRTAGLAYNGTSETSTGPGVLFCPEPSAALLGALGALGLLRRRRI